MNLLPSLLSFATLIQCINCRLLEPSSPVVATEKHEHAEGQRLFNDLLFNVRSSEGNGQCGPLFPHYYDYYDYSWIPVLSDMALNEKNEAMQSLVETGLADFSDSQYFVPEFISNICNSDKDEDVDSAVTYLVSLLAAGPECAALYSVDQVQFIDLPQCVRGGCTDDTFIAYLEKVTPDGCDFQNITVKRVSETAAKESIISID
jgi:hypothetical protein